MITFFTVILLGASFLVFLAAIGAWRRRDVPGGTALALMLMAIGAWCFFSALESTSLNEFQRYFWSSWSYVGLCNVPPLALVFALQYSDARMRPTVVTCLVIWSVPGAGIAFAFTNAYHHLIWTYLSTGLVAGTNTVIYHHGPWYWILMGWFLGLSLLASYHLLRVAVRAVRLYVMQAVVLLSFIVLPWIGLFFYILPNSPTAGLDTTSLGFALGAILILTALRRLRFMDLVPQARATLMENIREGVLVLDRLDRVIDVNAAACRLLRGAAPAAGSPLAEAFPVLCVADNGADRSSTRILSPFPGEDVTLELSVSPIVSRTGRSTGRLILLRDVSERRRAELDREKLITDLSAALSNVKKLSGLLPICASCKKIRDDTGYWHQVETYMEEHSEVEFSHGICPECAAKLYPEYSVPDEDTPG